MWRLHFLDAHSEVGQCIGWLLWICEVLHCQLDRSCTFKSLLTNQNVLFLS